MVVVVRGVGYKYEEGSVHDERDDNVEEDCDAAEDDDASGMSGTDDSIDKSRGS